MENRENRPNAAIIALLLTMIIGLAYQYLGKIIGPDTPKVLSYPLSSLFNLVLCGAVGYIFMRTPFLEQFKHFRFTTLLWGIPATIATGLLFGQLYVYLAGPATENNVASVITVSMVLLRVPFMLMGEELISTNVMIALQKKGFNFTIASIVCAILFAMWHIPAYGFVPLQLIITIVPTRLVLNYIWKRSNSVWVSWICHYVFDCISFLPFFF
ncbi:MAG: CPBP family intramembrane glutamic endopeptidase [Enterococcus sp.]